MQVTKRTFLKGLLATAAAGGVVSQASAKPQADLPAKWDREADVVILGYGGAGGVFREAGGLLAVVGGGGVPPSQ